MNLSVLFMQDGMAILGQELSSMTRSASLPYQHFTGSRYHTTLKILDMAIPVILWGEVK